MPVFSQEAELPIVYVADDSEGSRSANTAGAEREPESIAKGLARAARAVVPRTGMSDPLRLVVDIGGRPLVRKEPSGVPKAASEDRASPESVASSATVARRYQFDDGTFEAGIDSQGYIRQTAQRFQLQATGTVQWIEACFWRALADTNPDVAAVYYVHYDRGGRPGEALRDGVLAQGTVPADQEDSCLRRSVAVPVSERTVWVSVAYYGDFGVEYEDIEGFGKYLSVDTDTAGRTAVLIRDIDESDEVTNWRTPSEYAAGSVGIRIGTLEDDGSGGTDVSYEGNVRYEFLNSSGSHVRLTVDRIDNRSTATTGTLHQRFWATPGPSPVGRGFVLADDELYALDPNFSIEDIDVTLPVRRPPDGTYTLHLFLAEEPDLLTILDSRTFSRPVTFRDGRVFSAGGGGGRGNYSSCVPERPVFWLGDYRVSMCYETVDGHIGPVYDWGMGPGQSGLVYFFDRDNAEVLVKVLDGCGVNGYYWVFLAPVTDLGLNLYVEDRRGRSWSYRNRIGVQASTSSDTSAFRCN